jgi:hypothetical protein
MVKETSMLKRNWGGEPPLQPGYRYEVEEIEGSTIYTLYGPEGEESEAHDWIIAHVIGRDEVNRRRAEGNRIKFRYVEIEE